MLDEGQYTQPNSVASYILTLADRDSGEGITHLKLQKLVYYAQAWFLANFDRPLFEQDMEAWTHGPVSRQVYDRYKGNGWNPLPAPEADSLTLPKSVRGFVGAVYDEYGQYSAKKLEELTHSEKPWIATRGNLPIEVRCTDPIDKLLMRNFYASRLGKKEIKKLRD